MKSIVIALGWRLSIMHFFRMNWFDEQLKYSSIITCLLIWPTRCYTLKCYKTSDLWLANAMYTWSVQKVSRILNFRWLRIFDFQFFVVLCWYSYRSLMLDLFECSVNFLQLFCLEVFWLILDFYLFSFGNKKKSQGARSGKYSGRGNIFVLFLSKNLLTSNDMWTWALS